MTFFGIDGVRVMKMLAVAAGLLLVGVQMGGCASGPRYGPHEIEIFLSDDLKGKTVEVDLIAANNPESVESWRAKDVTKYFSANDKMRQEAITQGEAKDYRFSAGDTAEKKLLAQDSVWTGTWNNAQSIVVMANIPFLEGQSGPSDPRRVVITLQKGIWEGEKVRVQLGVGGVRTVSTPKPPKT